MVKNVQEKIIKSNVILKMTTKSLEILPIKPDGTRKPFPIGVIDPIPSNNFRLAFIGFSGAGKSVAMNNLVLRFLRGAFDAIYLISPSLIADETCRFLVQFAGEHNCFEEYDDSIIDGILDLQRRAKENGNMGHVLICVDDFIGELKQNAKVWSLFTKARHYNCSIIINSQAWKKIMPVARAQLTHIAYFRQGNQRELEKFIDEVLVNFCGNKKKAQELYLRATFKKYSFAFCDLQKFEIWRNFTEKIFNKFNDDGTYNFGDDTTLGNMNLEIPKEIKKLEKNGK